MGYYRYHLFFCTNHRDAGISCQNHNAQEARDYVKRRVKELGLAGPGNIRVNSAGCLDRCGEGPVIVVYPDEVWYRYADKEDLDEIIDEHLINGRPVERLRI